MVTSSTLDRAMVERIVRQYVSQSSAPPAAGTPTTSAPQLQVNVSARHIHLCDEHVERLFGPGATLTEMRSLYQDGFFAAEETLMLVGPRRRMLPSVRVLGPTRPFSQVELSLTDAISIGVDVPIRHSGNVDGTPGCVLVGPAGVVHLDQGLIRAARHVHMNHRDCQHFGVTGGDLMKLRIESPDCTMVMEDVLVRADDTSKLEVHIDTDEANACHLQTATRMELLRPDGDCGCHE